MIYRGTGFLAVSFPAPTPVSKSSIFLGLHVCRLIRPPERGVVLRVKINIESSLVQHFADRAISHRRKGAAKHLFDMMGLYRRPIPELKGRDDSPLLLEGK
jgi:hypothetical protein